MNESFGKLYLVATPIGNLDDITLRALNILREVDVIAAEDTRHTRKLLSRFDIHTKLISYHAHNEHHKTDTLLEYIQAGKKIALVSDAGTPAIADPGFYLVREAVKKGIEPEVIPGVSALTFSAVAAGIPVDRFAFYGFPPVKSGRRQKFFEQIGNEDKSVFIFESPHRITKALSNIVEYIGPETQVSVVREATKVHEEILRGTAEHLLTQNGDRKWKGECVIGIAPQLD
ncbi:MAG: 16S rRNA (cytidine(1402)-2'-O)-methyltransferase [Lentisphaerae bacterium]|nr:16S rRNA (cytidine(1402)-2'-O)-methyltransferase [Lentisphaerota bacterium]MCP4103790.1 16S rRNA (cytidine(1402)-2'-O)-methyltransferase [Lentisphaerota bacterium]